VGAAIHAGRLGALAAAEVILTSARGAVFLMNLAKQAELPV